jgi:hypothetical protein
VLTPHIVQVREIEPEEAIRSSFIHSQYILYGQIKMRGTKWWNNLDEVREGGIENDLDWRDIDMAILHRDFDALSIILDYIAPTSDQIMSMDYRVPPHLHPKFFSRIGKGDLDPSVIEHYGYRLGTDRRNDNIYNIIRSKYLDATDVSLHIPMPPSTIGPLYLCDPITMMRRGLTPRHKLFEKLRSDPAFVYYLTLSDTDRAITAPKASLGSSGESLPWERAINFWSRFTKKTRIDLTSYITNILSIVPYWDHHTLTSKIEDVLHGGHSVPLIISAPHLFYPSGRIKTDMMDFYKSTNHKVRRSDLKIHQTSPFLIYEVTISNMTYYAIPVTRYVSGMSKGLYHGDRPEDVCGTFYYLESDVTPHGALESGAGSHSSTLLLCRPNRYFSSRNKIQAYERVRDPSDPRLNFKIHDERERQIIYMYTMNILPPDLKMSPNDLLKLLGQEAEEDGTMDQTPRYVAKQLNLYALEDGYDQPLCKMAASKGYDLVILTSMPGSFQVVTEILDTRPQEESYASLIYIID